MSEENTNETQVNGEQQPAPAFAIKHIYLKDLSFETPMGIEAFNQQQTPQVNQEMNVQTNKLDESHHEVILLMTVTANIGDRVAFLIEVKQAGVFNISGLEGVQLAQVLNSACPNILFPYVRETIDSTLTRGSFSPIALPPINFDAVFAQAMEAAQKQQAQADTESEA